MKPVSMGALTQLYAATAPEAAGLNGKVLFITELPQWRSTRLIMRYFNAVSRTVGACSPDKIRYGGRCEAGRVMVLV
jgi:hypothetical protein